jgi:Co/Zn/Cd efflux system component
MPEKTRAAIAIVAFISGLMGFVESMAALPAVSTALAADALNLLQQSVNAGFALWAFAGVRRQRWTIWMQALFMIALGAGVCLIAAGRLVVGSQPQPFAMAIVGTVMLLATLACAAIMVRDRQQAQGSKRPVNFRSVWTYRSQDVVGHVAVIAAAAAVAVTQSRIPDIVIGGVMAVIFLTAGWQALVNGRVDEQF